MAEYGPVLSLGHTLKCPGHFEKVLCPAHPDNETRFLPSVYKLSRQGGLGPSEVVLRMKELNAMTSLASTGKTVGAKLMLPLCFFLLSS